MKHLYLITLITINIIAFGCKNSTIDSDTDQQILASQDTLHVSVTSGITMSLSGLKDSYSLTDTIKGVIELSNFADTNYFRVVFPFFPGYSFIIYDEHMKFSGGGPEGAGIPGIDFELTRGKKYFYDVYWSKQTTARVGGYILLPAFAGDYLLKFNLVGNADFTDKYLVKKINIKESGDQTPVAFVNSYDQYDIAILNLVMRNRFDNDITYHFKDSAYAELSILNYPNGQDTLYKEKYYFANNTLSLHGKTDSLLFWYRFDKKKTGLSTLNGNYIIAMKIKFVEREYHETCTGYFRNSGN